MIKHIGPQERETTLEDFDPRQIGDFFKLASVRDLLFHEQEHRFNLIQISEILKKLGLRFLGMEVSMPILTAFSSEYGESGMNNLEKWHAFENRYPSAFTGMYQMWLQKLS